MRVGDGWRFITAPRPELTRFERSLPLLRVALWSILFLLPACAPRLPESDPIEPQEALKTFEVAEGFRIEMVAAEPIVLDPVEIAFDENGGLYVAELVDNPDDPPEGEPARSRIAYLEDTDGDGAMDRRTVFAENVLTAEGVQPWKGGVIVTAAPDILYLKDTDGDRKADIRQVLYTGFAMENPEGRVSNPRFGLDNWIYILNHGYPGEIRSPDHADRPPVQVRGWDFRFHTERGEAGPASGDGQFGMSFDDWGNRYVSHNTTHIRQAVIPARYLMRNPFLTLTGADQDISDHGRPARIYPISQPQQWRIDRTTARQKRYQETRPGRIERLAGYFTASCGATVFTGDAFPADFANNVIVSDGNGNLVHRDVISPGVSTMKASRWPQEEDFVRSTDSWFRPVNFANGPDGNLYVVDYYRQYLEHPDFIPDAVQERLRMDFYRGYTRGRIYRIVPEEPRTVRKEKPNLGSASTEALVALLDHSNGWHRRTAHRLLFERQDEAAAPLLREMAVRAGTPQGRIHALWVLEGLSALDASLVEAALEAPHPGVRRNAVQLAEYFLPELTPSLIALVDDDSPQVRLQLALTLGEVSSDARVVRVMARLAARHAGDQWFRMALASAPPQTAMPLLTTLVRQERDFLASPSDDAAALLSELSRVVGARREMAEISRWLGALTETRALRHPIWRAASLKALAAGLKLEGRTGRRSRAIEKAIVAMLDDSEGDVRSAALDVAQYFELPALIDKALTEAANDDLPQDVRASAVRALRGASFAAARPVLVAILTSPSPQEVQTAAALTVASFDDEGVAETLLGGWRGYGPTVRIAVIEALLARPSQVLALLDAIESGQVELGSLDAVTRIKLAQYPDVDVRRRSAEVLESAMSDRAQVLADYRDVLDLENDPQRGEPVFERECAKCHLPSGERGRLGPNLSGVNNRDAETLLSHILDPSAAIRARYANYVLVTNNGYVHDGLLAGETAGTVTLRGEREDVTVLRRNIAELRASTVSLMPEGLEETMTRQELADVIAYLRAGL
ncbi:MAG: HEAT repeat domain-containing protein [Bryobacterales bacterium]|nr:HEAT repeat domain-containing protein [Bryobacterales bacterium]MDE0294210.1 HEAT repeat domain-containing protein [Bryobacterales bacterium]MDE0434785.1 HEAT repeat domain-containing protein [Bryobacterales bacterium]